MTNMDLERLGFDLWLLRGIPTSYKEPEVVAALSALGLRQPDFWYVPGIRKQSQENRGYAFIGFAGPGRGAEARRLMELFAKPGRGPWPLRLEWSTANIQSMVNNAWIWANNPVSDWVFDDEVKPPSRAPRPHYLEPWQCMLLEASSWPEQQEIEAPLYALHRFSQALQLQENQQRYAASADPAYVKDLASRMDFDTLNMQDANRDHDLLFAKFSGVCLSL
eukprot:TRINITY_DN33356_c0_g1_i1.p1 TRINITY_DN33356_c0_g1~~TRINITY_DN33356_c0_g1_i1.p1  ORF type:complete len:221 (-),score=41.65 TRINITY_DN33356_c0_g1_i1:211-873(-)